MTKAVLLSSVLYLAALPGFAATCADQALEKKLAGAAKASFLGKCERDATATCEATAAEKKLAGAAKTSFTGKCVRDTVGSAH